MVEFKIPPKIKEAIIRDELVFFIGAGFSQGLGYPNWKGLVKEILEGLSETYPDSEYEDLIPLLGRKIMPLVRVLEDIEEQNHTKESFDILENRFKSDDIDIDMLSKHKKIWKITEKIITTNYDLLLDKANPDAYKITHGSSYKQGKMPRLDRYLFKLHGCAKEDASKCILFKSQYEELYDPKDEKPAIFTLKNIIYGKTIIFLGFSMADPYVNYVFEWMQKLYEGNMDKHYILTTSDEDFSKYGVQPLKIGSWNDVDAYLDRLIQIKEAAKGAAEIAYTLDEPMVAVKPDVPTKAKLALCVASPIDKKFNCKFDDVIKELPAVDMDVECFQLSEKRLRELEGYDYLVLCTQRNKSKIFIEDKYLQSKLVTLEELADNIGDDGLKAVFMFLDDPSPLDDENIDLPFVFAKYDRDVIGQLFFKAFKKPDINTLRSDYQTFNADKLQLLDIAKGKATRIERVKKNIKAQRIDYKSIQDFMGRSLDLENIIRKIVDLQSNGQVLNIKGSGGIGKTTIAKKVAYELEQRGYFADGVYFVDCEQISSYRSFEYKVAQCFDIDGSINFKEHIYQNNMRMDALIILDNVETLIGIEEKEAVKELIAYISDYATILITCREVVLDNPGIENIYPMQNFTSDEAYELFCTIYIHGRQYDKTELRGEILEKLLNNNPLAIKLVTNNILDKKSLEVLKEELEQDFFRITDKDFENIYTRDSDTNIERLKSLYLSINYSYKRLSPKEKRIFEFLSLFPDGLHVEALKKLYKGKGQKYDNYYITDKDIKNLENKSLIELVNQNVKLLSIIRRFAELVFDRRSDAEKEGGYERAFGYNDFVLSVIIDMENKYMPHAVSMFDGNYENFLRSMDFIDKVELDKKEWIRYLYVIGQCCIDIANIDKFLAKIRKLENPFVKQEDGKLFMKVLEIYLRYYHNEFDQPFKDLSQILKFEDIEKQNIDETIAMALGIYHMEGKAFDTLSLIIKRNLYNISTLAFAAFELGMYKDIQNIEKFKKGFFYYEIEFNQGTIDISELEAYISSLYKKNYLGILQSHYIKAKLGKVDEETINKLQPTNPYTQGLKDLMFAFIQPDEDKAIQLYQAAIKNLEHIKYYHTEAIYYFTKFLREKQHADYQSWFDKGYDLARKHHYRFQRHLFECLQDSSTEPYDEDKYELPEKLDIDGFIKRYNEYRRK